MTLLEGGGAHKKEMKPLPDVQNNQNEFSAFCGSTWNLREGLDLLQPALSRSNER